MTDERKEANSNLNRAETLFLKSSLLENGFLKKRYGSYYRIVGNDLLQSIDIQKHSWQKTFTVNISISQLYQGHLDDHLSSIIIVRQGYLFTDKYRNENKIERIDHWYDFSDLNKTNYSMDKLRVELEEFIYPFLDKVITNRLLADFVLERTFNKTPDFIQPDTTWSNYFAGLLALRIEDSVNSSYFLKQTIENANKIKWDWGKRLYSETLKLENMIQSGESLISDYFHKNTLENIKRYRLKNDI